MNTFIETLNQTSEGLPRLAWQMFCQSSLLIIVVFAMDFLLRRKLRASVRYSLWLVVLIKLLLPPTLALPTGIAWWLLPSDAPPAPVQARQIIVTHLDNPIPFHQLPAPTIFEQPALRLSGQAWILIVAATISIALLMWLLVRWFQISRTVRQAGEPTDSLLAALDEARRFVRISPRTRLRLTKDKMSPAVCGLFRPVILLPKSLVENLSGNQMRAVLIHELVHLKRGDVWVNCLQALVQIVYWWHPLVWFANARIRRVREEAVDDAVMLALRDEADCYAPTLLEVAKHAFHRPLASLGLVGILESRGALRQRIERLIDFKTPRRAGLSIVSILAIVAFTAAAVPMGEAPPRSSSETKATQGTHSGSDTNSSFPRNMTDPQFKTVLTKLQQREQLSQLIQDARLFFELGKYDEAERRLNEALQVDPKSAAANYYLALVRRSQDQKKISGSGNLVNDLVYRTTNQQAHAAKPIQLAQNSSLPASEPLQATAPISPLDGVLAFDKELKEATVNTGEAEAKFKFNLTNVSSFDVTITNILTSCGCTVAKMPASPWLLAPGTTGEIPVTMNVAGKAGEVTKTVTVNSDKGSKTLIVKATIHSDQSTSAPGQPVPNPYARTNLNNGRQAIIHNLNQIRLEEISYDRLSLSEVVRQLSEVVRNCDPEKRGINFLINQQDISAPTPSIDATTGLPVATPSVSNAADIKTVSITLKPALRDIRLADALDAIVNSANKPIKYSILDYAIVFSPQTESDRANQQLYSRRFRVDPNTFILNLEKASGTKSDGTRTNFLNWVQSTIIAFFQSLGVKMEPPKSVFFGDRDGTLWVRATKEDLDLIEQAIQTVNAAPAQVTIRVQFVELHKDIADALSLLWQGTNSPQHAGAVSAILTAPQLKDLLKALQNKAGVNELTDGNVTTLSGRQAQIQMVEKKDFITRDPQTGLLRTNTVPCGPVLDVNPTVSPDGYTIQMTVAPSLTEFLGYDNSTPPRPRVRTRQTSASAILWDGQTLVLSQFIPKEIAFDNSTTSVTSTAEDPKRNLLVLVTPTIIDPAGNRIHADEK